MKMVLLLDFFLIEPYIQFSEDRISLESPE